MKGESPTKVFQWIEDFKLKNQREQLKSIDNELSEHLRNRQESYVGAINKIIYELGKKKIADDQRKYEENRKNKMKEAYIHMTQIEDIYDTQIKNLKKKARMNNRKFLEQKKSQKTTLSDLQQNLKFNRCYRMDQKVKCFENEIMDYDQYFQEDADVESKFLAIFHQNKKHNLKPSFQRVCSHC